MPQPYGRDNLSPEDLARQVAEHLAETSQKPRRFSLKNSVLVGRFMTGAMVLAFLFVGVLAVMAGGNWLLDRAGERETEVLSIAPIGSSLPGGLSTTTSTLGTDFLMAVVAGGSDGGVSDRDPTGRASFLPALPPPTTTTPASPVTTTPGATTPSSTGTGPTVTQPGSPPPAPPFPSTTLPSQTTTTGNTTSTSEPTTTSTTDPSTTTTMATTTTSEATTTTSAATSTTCGNKGNGNGNCGP